jgi:hypothetical protein
MILMQKGYFLKLKQVYVGLIMFLFQVSLLLFGQEGLGHFFRYRPLLHIVQSLRQRRWKTTNTAPTTLIAIQAASQSTFPNEQLSTICD